METLAYFIAWSSQPRSVTKLASLAKIPRNAAGRACRRLVSRGWMTFQHHGRAYSPVAAIPPHCQEQLARRLEAEYDQAANKGEFLMKRYLDLRVASEEYVDNARPAVLENPLTKENLECDRLYAQGIAFEFNGPQHSERTQKFSSERDLRETKARDLIKKGLSQDANIRLITVSSEQLYVECLEALLPPELPRRPLDTSGEYYRTLARLSAAYSSKARTGALT